MKPKISKFLIASLVLMCILTFALFPQTIAAPHNAKVYLKVTPEVVGTATPGEQVTVDIAINDLGAEDRLVALEWRLRFDPGLLEVLDTTEGNYLRSEAENAAAETGEDYGIAFHWQWDPGTDFIISFSLYYKIPWPPEVFPGNYSNGGTLATVTFNAISIPEEVTEVDLTIFDVRLLDVDGNGILYDHLEHGKYLVPTADEDLNIDGRVNIVDMYIFAKYFGTCLGHPRGWFARADINDDGKVNMLDGVRVAKKFGKITTPKLFLKVEPEDSHVSVDEEFSINITINDIEWPLRIVAVEWKLRFDTSILEVVEVVEGDFLRTVAEEAGPDYGTAFAYHTEDDYTISFTLYYKYPWPPGVFPSGGGTLATIKFHTIAEGTSILRLDDVELLDVDGNPVKYHHLEDGIAIVK